MNCRSCTIEDAKKAQQAALVLLRTPGTLPKEDTEKAIACRECAFDKLVTEATKRLSAC